MIGTNPSTSRLKAIKAAAALSAMDKPVAKGGRVYDIKDVRIGRLNEDGGITDDENGNIVWAKIAVDGKHLNGDGLYGFVNLPLEHTDTDDEIKKRVLDILTETIR